MNTYRFRVSGKIDDVDFGIKERIQETDLCSTDKEGGVISVKTKAPHDLVRDAVKATCELCNVSFQEV